MPNADSALLSDQQRLNRLHQLCLLDSPLDPAFDRLTQLATRILNMPVSLVTLVDSERQFFKSQVGLPEPYASLRQTPLAYSFCQHTVATAQPLVIEDARQHPLVCDNPAIHDLGAVAYAGIPLITSDGVTLGTFCVMSDAPHIWTDDQLWILHNLARSVMTEIELHEQLIERRLAEQALRKAEQELETSLWRLSQAYDQISDLEALKSDMLRIAAHDLRGPLHDIMGFTDLLLEDRASLSEDHQQFVQMMRVAQVRMYKIITDILSLQRIEMMVDKHHHPLVDLREITAEVCEYFRPTARQHNQRFTVALPDAPAQVHGDPAQLHAAIHNLVSNALKYTPVGGEIAVRLSQYSGGCILFEVQDTGCGIPQDQQARLFEPFFRARTAETERIDGSGLGLSLVKRIIERHSGEMRFDSVYQQGSTFGFMLPGAIVMQIEQAS